MEVTASLSIPWGQILNRQTRACEHRSRTVLTVTGLARGYKVPTATTKKKLVPDIGQGESVGDVAPGCGYNHGESPTTGAEKGAWSILPGDLDKVDLSAVS